MIEICGLKKDYKGTPALNGVDLHVLSGEIFAYLGPNGAGKTTTIRILTGLTRLSAGRAALGGCDIEREPLAAKRRFGLVPQHINLDRELSVQQNLTLHGRLHHLPKSRIQKRTDELLDYIDLSGRRHTPIKELSGGLKRRVMIARALVHEPEILFLDEPTVGLDAEIRRRIWALIKRIQALGVTVFLTTHYIEEAEALADRVAFIDQGLVVALDTPAKLKAGLGEWALDRFGEHTLETLYFPTREEAGHCAAGQAHGCTLRRVNLEDAFLAMTGRKVRP